MTQLSTHPGQRVSEYILEKLIGRGGFAEVWRARHHVWTDDFAAVKIPLDDEFIKQLRSEGDIQHKLDHPNIVRILGFDPHHDPPYLVTEYVPGKNLRQAFQDQGPFSMTESLPLCFQTLDALSYAHDNGVVHYDVKPENILIDDSGQVKLADFGLGKVFQTVASSLIYSATLDSTQGNSISGTLAYMSPEQKSPNGDPIDCRSDVYSFGLVLFEMLTGELPQGGELPSDLVADAPREVDSIFSKCYTRLENRFRSAGEVLAALEKCFGKADSFGVRSGGENASASASEKWDKIAYKLRKKHAKLQEELEKKGRKAAKKIKEEHARFRQRLEDKRNAAAAASQQTGLAGEAVRQRPPAPVAKPAGFFIRLIAFGLDCLFLTLVFWPMVIAMNLTAIFPLIYLSAIYYTLMTAIWGGTLGKLILGVKVVKSDGRRVGFWRSFLRCIGYAVCDFTLGLGYLVVIFNSEKRGLHDLIADTKVVHR